jgi:cation diffusion facilitator CzcD-associated flavoprotein CzcO
MGSIEQSEVGYTDVLIIGAGFGAFTVLNRVRRQGFDVTIYEKGASSGGSGCFVVATLL